MEWQAIDTAPMDGSHMLLQFPTLGVVYGCYDNEGTADWWIIRPRDEAWWSPYMKQEESPLLWMPMPEAAPLGNVVLIKPITNR